MDEYELWADLFFVNLSENSSSVKRQDEKNF